MTENMEKGNNLLSSNVKKIGIDIDEVVVEFMKHFIDYWNLEKGTSFRVEDLETYHLWETPVHLSKEESMREVLKFQMSPLFEQTSFVEGVFESIRELAKIHKIFFVTARPKEIRGETENMLNENLSGVDFNIFFSGDVYGGKSKSEICIDCGADILIEDNYHYAVDCAEKGIKVFLLDKPWNRNCDNNLNIKRVSGWKEIVTDLK